MPRRKGSRNRGYYYRRNRGWCAKGSDGREARLNDVDGNPLRDRHADKEIIKAAHDRFRQQQPTTSLTIWELSQHYLGDVEQNGASSTLDMRADVLYDFSTGFGRIWRKSKARPNETDRIHAGFGSLVSERLTQDAVCQWLDKHPGWDKGSRRIKLQALKRMFNFGVEAKLIGRNPLRGMRVPKPGARITCISPEQEAELLSVAYPALQEAIRVLIRTGMRPSEFARLTPAHVQALGDKLELRFRPDEVKTRKARVVRVADPAIVETVKGKLDKPRLFTNKLGKPWRVKTLSRAFLRAKGRASRKLAFDADCCLYSCRHTFAKRVLTGYWNGKAVSIEVLSHLMGNTPEVCRANYLQWSESYTQPLWDAVG